MEDILKELKPPIIPTKDLSAYIKIKERNPKMRIGVLKSNIEGLSSYKANELVLFTPYTIEECYRRMEWKEIEQHIKLCTIEVPAIHYFPSENPFLTIKPIVGVPQSYIEYEILI